MYFASTAVFITEIIKLSLSLTLALSDIATKNPQLSATELFSRLFFNVFSHDSWMMAIPALLYTAQNTLQYVAASNLDASTVHIIYQLRIASTALFSSLLLRRKIDSKKWLSLLLLVAGAAAIYWPMSTPAAMQAIKNSSDFNFWVPRSLEELRFGKHGTSRFFKRSATYQGMDKDATMRTAGAVPIDGLLATLSASITSGLAGVYLERVLKSSQVKGGLASGSGTSIWVRNVQLSLFSVFPALFFGIMFVDGDRIARVGFFAGYNWAVWTSIALQAIGGLLVALAISHSTNIAKNFATSLSILPTFVGSVILFDLNISVSVSTPRHSPEDCH